MEKSKMVSMDIEEKSMGYQELMQDYLKLEKKTKAKRRKLEKINKKKLELSHEVRFLRGKFKQLSNKSPEGKLYRLREQPPTTIVPNEIPLNVGNNGGGEASIQSTNALPDLNQIATLDDEEMERIQTELEPTGINLSKGHLGGGDEDAGNGVQD